MANAFAREHAFEWEISKILCDHSVGLAITRQGEERLAKVQHRLTTVQQKTQTKQNADDIIELLGKLKTYCSNMRALQTEASEAQARVRRALCVVAKEMRQQEIDEIVAQKAVWKADRVKLTELLAKENAFEQARRDLQALREEKAQWNIKKQKFAKFKEDLAPTMKVFLDQTTELETLRRKETAYDQAATELETLRENKHAYEHAAVELETLRQQKTACDQAAVELKTLRQHKDTYDQATPELQILRQQKDTYDRSATELGELRQQKNKFEQAATALDGLRQQETTFEQAATELDSLRQQKTTFDQAATELARLQSNEATLKLDHATATKKLKNSLSKLDDLRKQKAACEQTVMALGVCLQRSNTAVQRASTSYTSVHEALEESEERSTQLHVELRGLREVDRHKTQLLYIAETSQRKQRKLWTRSRTLSYKAAHTRRMELKEHATSLEQRLQEQEQVKARNHDHYLQVLSRLQARNIALVGVLQDTQSLLRAFSLANTSLIAAAKQQHILALSHAQCKQAELDKISSELVTTQQSLDIALEEVSKTKETLEEQENASRENVMQLIQQFEQTATDLQQKLDESVKSEQVVQERFDDARLEWEKRAEATTETKKKYVQAVRFYKERINDLERRAGFTLTK